MAETDDLSPTPYSQVSFWGPAEKFLVGLLISAAVLAGVFIFMSMKHADDEVAAFKAEQEAAAKLIVDPSASLRGEELKEVARKLETPVKLLTTFAKEQLEAGSLDSAQLGVDRAVYLRASGIGDADDHVVVKLGVDVEGAYQVAHREWSIDLVRIQRKLDDLRKDTPHPPRFWEGANTDEIEYPEGAPQRPARGTVVIPDMGLQNLRLARWLEELDEPGRALDAYREALKVSKADDPWKHDAQTAIERLEPLEPLPRSTFAELIDKQTAKKD